MSLPAVTLFWLVPQGLYSQAVRKIRCRSQALATRCSPSSFRIVDMSASNAWAEFAGTFRPTRPAFLEHEDAKAEPKKLVPEDAREAIGHGLRAKRSKSGAVSFDLLEMEATDAPR